MNPLSPSSETTNVPIPKDATFEKIKVTLCEKRKALEDSLSQSPSAQVEDELQILKADMQTLGISEVDYTVFIAKHSEN